MPGMGGQEALRKTKVRWPLLKVIILTMHDEPAVVRNLMSLGADGYLLKNCYRDEFVAPWKQYTKETSIFPLPSPKDC